MIRRVMFVSACVLGMAAPAMAQQLDMEAMQKWMAAKNVTWHVVGKYEGDPSISSDGVGFAHVTDVIEFDVTMAWQDDNAIVGTPKIRNVPSVVTNPHDSGATCVKPVLKGEFDYATLDAVTAGIAGGLHFTLTRTFPDVVVSQVCSGTKLARAKKQTEEAEMPFPQPTFLAMGMSDQNTSLSPDKKSIVLKHVASFTGWVWTLTPTPK